MFKSDFLSKLQEPAESRLRMASAVADLAKSNEQSLPQPSEACTQEPSQSQLHAITDGLAALSQELKASQRATEDRVASLQSAIKELPLTSYLLLLTSDFLLLTSDF